MSYLAGPSQRAGVPHKGPAAAATLGASAPVGWAAAGAGHGKTLTAPAAGTTTFDGVLLADGDRVLVKDLATQAVSLAAEANVADSLNGAYILLTDAAGSVAFWFNSNAGAAPGVAATEIEVAVGSNDSAALVADALRSAVNTAPASNFTAGGASPTVTIAGAHPILAANSAASAGTTGWAVFALTTGLDPNGVYAAGATAAGSATVLTRATDFDGSPAGEVAGGALVTVLGGTQAGTEWVVQGAGAKAVDTDGIQFARLIPDLSLKALNDVGDVFANAPANGDLLAWNSGPMRWQTSGHATDATIHFTVASINHNSTLNSAVPRHWSDTGSYTAPAGNATRLSSPAGFGVTLQPVAGQSVSLLASGAGTVAVTSRITGVLDGTAAGDAVNKGQLDNAIAGLNHKQEARVCTLVGDPPSGWSAIAGAGVGKTITAPANGTTTVDGTLLANGDRVLVKGVGFQVVTFGAAGDSPNNSIDGRYFVVNDSVGTHAFWFKTSGGTATAPGVADTETVVNVATGATANAVASATRAVVDALAEFTGTGTGSSIVVTNARLANIQATPNAGTLASAASAWAEPSVSSDYRHNGIYTVSNATAGAATTLTRAADADGSPAHEVAGGDFVTVQEGTCANTGWVLQGTGNKAVDTDGLLWVQFIGADIITVGAGLSKTGSAISLAAGLTDLTDATVTTPALTEVLAYRPSSAATLATENIETVALSSSTSRFAQSFKPGTGRIRTVTINDISGNGSDVQVTVGLSTVATAIDGPFRANVPVPAASGGSVTVNFNEYYPVSSGSTYFLVIEFGGTLELSGKSANPSTWSGGTVSGVDFYVDGVARANESLAFAYTLEASASVWRNELPGAGLIPTGTVSAFAGPFAPSGWLFCDGASYLRATYAALFAVIGTAWGAADGTHFNVPDLRGRFVRGYDAGAGNDPDAAGRTALLAGGAAGNNVGSYQADEFESHTHVLGQSFGGSLNAGAEFYAQTSPAVIQNAITTAAGGSTETRPKNACVLYIIKM